MSRLKSALSIVILIVFLPCCMQRESPSVSLPDYVDFNFHIKPILSDRCFSCHGPDAAARKAGLRLDTETGLASVTKGWKQELQKRIHARDPEFMMPPPESKLSLSSEEILLIDRWIKQGAKWEGHWSFEAPSRPDLPKVEQKDWVNNELDHFILHQLEKRAWKPAPEADRATLLRRLSFDLIGLPPSLEELDRFINDQSPGAFEKQVDRLLASPRFGERMAADWMDVARYADTHGYLDDMHREVWHWRDWVIQAYNKNLPYDQFLKWQIAGDLIPNASQEQILATCFQRLHRQNQEGGVLPEEYRVEYVADRVQTTSKAFLGLTMECARCHDHKYDPISQKDFYQMAAFFNNNLEVGRAPIGRESGPIMLLTDAEKEDQLRFIQQQLEEQTELYRLEEEKWESAFGQWLADDQNVQWADEDWRDQGLLAHFTFEEVDNNTFSNHADPDFPGRLVNWKEHHFVMDSKFGNAIRFGERNAVIIGKEIADFERTEPFSVSLWVRLPKIYEDASVFSNCDHKWHAYRGYEMRLKEGKLLFRLANSYPHNAIQVETVNALPVNEWLQVMVTYDGSSKAKGIRLYLNGKEADTKIVYDKLYKSILHDDQNDKIVMPYWGFALGMRFNDPTLLGGDLDELRIYNRALTALEAFALDRQNPSADLKTLLKTGFKNDESNDLLFEYFREHIARPRSAIFKLLKKIQRRQNELLTPLKEVMVLEEGLGHRPTYVLDRGRYDAPQEEVTAGVPANIMPYRENWPQNRLGLAEWLVDPANPLTARVAVNRFWQMFFGRGLVATPDDFGSQGALPSHPELLDHLATSFIDSGWDIKALLRGMVTSATYRQSSVERPKIREADPDNRFLAHFPRSRLSAEMLRDNALATSGLLTKEIGGPSIKPYQPEGLWKEQAFQKWTVYEPDRGEKLYKRSLYIYWKRNTPHPYMTTFDIPDRAACSVQRHNTNTPAQALMLLNYPQFVEAAKVLAERLLMDGERSLEERLALAFRTLTSRLPNETEMQLMKDLYRKERKRFSKDPAQARQFLAVGDYVLKEGTEFVPTAALAVVVHSVMNTPAGYLKR